MDIKVQKWGNSLAIRLPKAFTSSTNIKKGSKINMSVKDGKIILTPLNEEKYSLEELISKVNPENMHREINMGGPEGKEIW